VEALLNFKKPMPTFLKYFHEIEREGTLPNSFCETSITLTLKLGKDRTEKKIITGQSF
jgi:hypothetical protein